MNIVSEMAVLGDKSDIAQYAGQYMAQHPNDTEAQAALATALYVVKRVGTSGLAGALSGTAMGGAAQVRSNLQEGVPLWQTETWEDTQEAESKNAEEALPVQPVRVGKNTVIQRPYANGPVPKAKTGAQYTPVAVADAALTQANEQIAAAQAQTGKGFKKSLTDFYREALGSIFSGQSVTVENVRFEDRPYDVALNKSVIEKVISDRNISAEKLAVFNNIEDIVRNAEYVGSGEYTAHGAKTKPVTRYDYFETQADIGGQLYTVSFDVEVFPQNNNYRTHRVINNLEIEAAGAGGTGIKKEGLPPVSAVRTAYSVADTGPAPAATERGSSPSSAIIIPQSGENAIGEPSISGAELFPEVSETDALVRAFTGGTLTNAQIETLKPGGKNRAAFELATGLTLPETASRTRALLKLGAAEGIDGTLKTEYNKVNGGVYNGTENPAGASVASGEGIQIGRVRPSSNPANAEGWQHAGGNRGTVSVLTNDADTANALSRVGSAYVDMHDTTAQPQAFTAALDDAIKANKHGLMVSPKTPQELADSGAVTFMTNDGLAGAAVTADGDIEAVFKNPASQIKRASAPLMLNAIENGGRKLDCYGIDLVQNYNKFGFEPVARVAWNPEYAPDGWTYGPKDVYVMKLADGLDADGVKARLGVSETGGGFHKWTQAELDALPEMDYDAASGGQTAPGDAQRIKLPTAEDFKRQADFFPPLGQTESFSESILTRAKTKVSVFLERLLKTEGRIEKESVKLPLWDVPQSIAEQVKKASNGMLDITGKKFIFNAYDIWHEYKQHSGDQKAASQGQYPLTEQSFVDALEVLAKPEYIEFRQMPDAKNLNTYSFLMAKKSTGTWCSLKQQAAAKKEK